LLRAGPSEGSMELCAPELRLIRQAAPHFQLYCNPSQAPEPTRAAQAQPSYILVMPEGHGAWASSSVLACERPGEGKRNGLCELATINECSF
jgi:hypothetical protein